MPGKKKSSEADELKELRQRVASLEKQVTKLREMPTMYELMGMTNPNAPWIGEKYRDIKTQIEVKRGLGLTDKEEKETLEEDEEFKD